MSLDTYTNLKQEIIDWSHRDDLDLLIDTFIDLAETEMLTNRDDPLRVESMESSESFTTSTTVRTVALPTGYKEMRDVRLVYNDETYQPKYRNPNQLQIYSDVGTPGFYTVRDQVEFDRISDQAYTGTFYYYQEFTPLSSTNATNSVLTNYPSVYLYGSLWALFTHSMDTESADRYYSLFINAIRGANSASSFARTVAPVQTVEGMVV
jgi:hypothetical protein